MARESGLSAYAGVPIRVVDSHTEREPTRVVIEGGPALGDQYSCGLLYVRFWLPAAVAAILPLAWWLAQTKRPRPNQRGFTPLVAAGAATPANEDV